MAHGDANFAYFFANREAGRMAGEEVASAWQIVGYTQDLSGGAIRPTKREAATGTTHPEALCKARAEGDRGQGG